MLTIPFIRENENAFREGLRKRNFSERDIDLFFNQATELDQQRKTFQQKADACKAQVNAESKKVGELIKAGKANEAEQQKAAIKELKAEGDEATLRMEEADCACTQLLYKIPNIPHTSVPAGKTADDNKVMHTWGTIPTLHAQALPHWELIKKYDIIDFDLGIKISGAGFPVYKGKGAKLQRALIQFFLDEAEAQGYVEIQPPIVVNEASGYGTGQLPDKEGQMYHIGEDGLYLIPTAEVPITNLYRDMVVQAEQLPIKHVGYTPCFRREAGSWGAHVRGLNRLHQFDKVEIVQICLPEHSYATLEAMSLYVQSLLEKLELPYRKLLLCGGDMGFNSALTYDMEVWSAAQQRWLEVSSVSNFETFQANRMKLRYKHDGKTQLLHTLNGSALALPRIVASILENNQRENGIAIPKILQPYTGFDFISLP